MFFSFKNSLAIGYSALHFLFDWFPFKIWGIFYSIIFYLFSQKTLAKAIKNVEVEDYQLTRV